MRHQSVNTSKRFWRIGKIWLTGSILWPSHVAAEPVFAPCAQAVHGAAFYGAECVQLPVSTYGSDHIATLNVLKARALSTPTTDPLVVITGAPGTSAVNLAWQYLGFFTGVLRERDIIFIDQRGTGKSEPFNCAASDELDTSLPAETLVAQTQAALITCAKQHTNLATITTHQAALDIEQVRKQLGYEQLNVWGSSYGTRVALEYQRLFPRATRTVIIDGVAPAIIGLPRYAEHDASSALKALLLACQDQPSCKQTFPDLEQTWRRLIADLAAKPRRIEFTHPRTRVASTVTVSAALVANWVRFALYSRELSALLPLAIHNASEGDFQALANLAQTASDSVQDGMSRGMHAAILCAEDKAAPRLPAANADANPLPMPFAQLNDLGPVCAAMPEPLAPVTPLFEPVKSAVPTLVLSGRFDPVTPAFWGDWASQQLSHSAHWVIKGGHHGASGLGCVPKLINEFIHAASATTLDTQCLSTIVPTAFFTDSAGPALSLPDSLPKDES